MDSKGRFDLEAFITGTHDERSPHPFFFFSLPLTEVFLGYGTHCWASVAGRKTPNEIQSPLLLLRVSLFTSRKCPLVVFGDDDVIIALK